MNFYAFKPTKEGREPLGTDNRIVMRDYTYKRAHAMAQHVFGNDFRMYSYTNFYDNSTFKLVCNPSMKEPVGDL